MPPEDDNTLPDSALGLMNIHQAAGLDDRARKRVWETTRKAIERQGLELQGEIRAGGTAVVFDARENIGGRFLGRRLIVKVIGFSPFVLDAKRNQEAWEKRYLARTPASPAAAAQTR